MLPLPTLKKSLSAARDSVKLILIIVVAVPAFMLLTGHWNWPLVVLFSVFPLTLLLWNVCRAILVDINSHPALRLYDGETSEDLPKIWGWPSGNIGKQFQFQGRALVLTAIPDHDAIFKMYQGGHPISVPRDYYPVFSDSEGGAICFVGSRERSGAVVRLKAGSTNVAEIAPSVGEFLKVLTRD